MVRATNSVTPTPSNEQAAPSLANTIDQIERHSAEGGRADVAAAYERRDALEHQILTTTPATANEALTVLLLLSDAFDNFALNSTVHARASATK